MIIAMTLKHVLDDGDYVKGNLSVIGHSLHVVSALPYVRPSELQIWMNTSLAFWCLNWKYIVIKYMNVHFVYSSKVHSHDTWITNVPHVQSVTSNLGNNVF